MNDYNSTIHNLGRFVTNSNMDPQKCLALAVSVNSSVNNTLARQIAEGYSLDSEEREALVEDYMTQIIYLFLSARKLGIRMDEIVEKMDEVLKTWLGADAELENSFAQPDYNAMSETIQLAARAINDASVAIANRAKPNALFGTILGTDEAIKKDE
jgi:hypothetical protein